MDKGIIMEVPELLIEVIVTSWYTKMYNIKLTEHLLYTRILCLLLSLYST